MIDKNMSDFYFDNNKDILHNFRKRKAASPLAQEYCIKQNVCHDFRCLRTEQLFVWIFLAVVVQTAQPIGRWICDIVGEIRLHYIKHLGLSQVDVIGCSGGALAVLNLSLEHPDLVNTVAADSFEGTKALVPIN